MTAFDYKCHDWSAIFNAIDNGPRGTQARIAREIAIDDRLLSRIYARRRKDPDYDPAKLTNYQMTQYQLLSINLIEQQPTYIMITNTISVHLLTMYIAAKEIQNIKFLVKIFVMVPH